MPDNDLLILRIVFSMFPRVRLVDNPGSRGGDLSLQALVENRRLDFNWFKSVAHV